MAQYEQILTRNEGGVLTITMNRPDRLNAWTDTMQSEIQDAVTAASDDDSVRCIVVTGAGRGYCAGADMDGLQQIQASEGDDSGNGAPVATGGAPDDAFLDLFPGRFGYLFACPKPIISAINGPCAGIGFVFSLFSDLRFAANEAKFTTAFSQRGLIAEHGCAWLLPRLIGEANALDILMTARKFLGDEAAAMGLVNAALPGDQLMDHVYATANHLATQVSPRSTAIMKRQIRESYFQNYGQSLAVADHEMEQSFSTFDFKEGISSFVERRAPKFKGR